MSDTETKTIRDYPPLVQLSVDQILGLVGAGFGREDNELWQELFGHLRGQLVSNGQSFTCTSGAHTQHLKGSYQKSIPWLNNVFFQEKPSFHKKVLKTLFCTILNYRFLVFEEHLQNMGGSNCVHCGYDDVREFGIWGDVKIWHSM